MEEDYTPISDIISRHISLSRFAKCIGISRPTLYKYMDAYDSKDMDSIPDGILKVFDDIATTTNKTVLNSYFHNLYADYVRTEERRSRDEPVPPNLAEIIDFENLDSKDIDLMIERAQRRLKRESRRDPFDEYEVEKIRKDICDLEYTRGIVERRRSENRFLLIYSADWTACIGPGESDIMDYDEVAEVDVIDINSKFRFYLTRAYSGYTLFFCNEEEGDEIEVQLLTGPCDDKTLDVVGTFHPEPGMRFVRIPDLFQEDFEDLFRYRVVRSRGGMVLNSAVGVFTV